MFRNSAFAFCSLASIFFASVSLISAVGLLRTVISFKSTEDTALLATLAIVGIGCWALSWLFFKLATSYPEND